MTLPACLVSLSFRFTGEPLYRQAEAATANLLDVMVDYAVTTSCSRLNVKNSTWLIQIAESLSGEDGAADREKMGKKFHDCNVPLQKPQGLESLALLFLKTSQRLLPHFTRSPEAGPRTEICGG